MNKFKSGVLLLSSLLMFSSCLNDDDDNDSKKSEWRELNEEYVAKCENEMENGSPVYSKFSPDVVPGNFILMRWHKGGQNPAAVTPVYNSTVNVIYDLRLADGTKLENSFSLTANGDSIYQTMPSSNIPGFGLALTRMSEGDSCTVVIPSAMAYGNLPNGKIPAYSALVYGIKLKKIVAYESQPSK